MNCEQLIQAIQNMQLGKNWIDILSALLTPTIAISALLITFFQWKTNRDRLKNELFDRRYIQFVAIRDFLGSIFGSGTASDEAIMKLHHETKGIRFLFDKKISTFLIEKIKKPANLLGSLNRELDAIRDQKERKINLKKQRELKDQLEQEFYNLETLFASYLQLKH